MRSDRKKILTAKALLLGSLVLQCCMLLKVYKSMATLTPDLFEMFRSLGYPYFAASIVLLASIIVAHRITKGMSFNFVFMALMCLVLYKLLPKYVYRLPLQREIYHTANIMYVYKYYSVNVPGYPSMPESVGYAIFYATLGRVIGLESQSFIDFLAIFTDLFHLFIVLIISVVIAKHYMGLRGIRLLYVLSMPTIFMLQINTTYRNGFGALLFVYAIALLNIVLLRATTSREMLIMSSLILLASVISYSGLIPLLTIGMLPILLVICIHHLPVIKSTVSTDIESGIERVKNIFSFLMIGNIAWFIWQATRYPRLFNAIKMYIDSLIELFSERVEIEAFTTRIVIYNNTYNWLLTLRAIYAIILLALISVLALAILFRVGREKENTVLSASLALGFAVMILLGAKGNFHFAAIYNVLSLSSAILISSLLNSNIFNSFVQRLRNNYKVCDALRMLFAITFCVLVILSPIALWPAFKNLMPIEAREVKMFKVLAEYAMVGVEISYLSLYGDTMGTAIRYVFADRIDITIHGLPYPIDTLPPTIGFLVSSNSIISSESKAKFIEPLHIWLTNFLLRLYVEKMFNKILDLGHHHEALLKSL